MQPLLRLHYTLASNGIPVLGVSGGPPPAPVRVDYDPAATAAQQTQGDSIVAGFDWTPTNQVQTPADNTQARADAATLLDLLDAEPKLLRAILLALLDQLNTIRAALPKPLAPITPTQARNAVKAKLNDGSADV